MSMRILVFLSFHLCLLFLGSEVAYGANLRSAKGVAEKNCSLVLEGEISAGDANALQSVLPYAERGEFTLCLNSHGGSLIEGIQMSDIIADRGVATLIKSGSVCASACALTFLGGTCSASGDAGIYENHCRFVEPGAIVGFHAPFMQALEQARSEIFSADDVRRIWATSRVAAGLYAEALSNREVPMDMIVEFLAVDPNDLSVIDTIDAARRMNIIVLGLQPSQLSSHVIIEMCSDVLKDPDRATAQYEEGDPDFQIEVLKLEGREVIIASQLSYLNFPYATWTACRVEYKSSSGHIFPPYAQLQGMIAVEQCDRIILEIPRSLKTPIPRYSWKSHNEIEALGNLLGEDRCVTVHEYFGLEAEMWARAGASKIDAFR
jgi:hypothetical protein